MRITNINDIDLNKFTFDFDLTMAFLLANPDGTVYHRYGGRTNISPMNMSTLIELLKKGEETHRQYIKNPFPPPKKSALKIRALVEQKLKGQMKPVNGCYHCHYVREAKQFLAVKQRTWNPSQFWIFPLPKRLGLNMNQKKQYQVDWVYVDSPADRAGIKKGDLLQTLLGKRIVTKYDIQWILENQISQKVALPFSVLRNNKLIRGTLKLSDGWKVGDSKEYEWRVNNVYTEHMRKYLPTPGLTGTQLSEKDLILLEMSKEKFALKVTHVNYGTYLSGIRKGDIILSAGDKSDFKTPRDFYFWCEMMRVAKKDIKIELLRHGTKMKLMVVLNYLSYMSVENSPDVMLGFIAQELPNNNGLRVGNVVDGSSAERSGLLVGDLIILIDKKRLLTFKALKNLLDNKTPGDIIRFKIQRGNKFLHFAYSLVDEEKKRSKLAILSDKVTKKSQEIICTISIDLPKKNHIYSIYKHGFGLPTQVKFRGTGFKLIGQVSEPQPKKIQEDGLETMWVLEGNILLKQKIKITDVKKFHLYLEMYAQVCDEKSCSEFRAVIDNDGKGRIFSEYFGDFNRLPLMTP